MKMRTYPIACVLVLFGAIPLAAQMTPEQARAIADKSVVTVTVRDGAWKGHLLDIDADSVTIQTRHEAEVRLPLADVFRVDTKKPDSIGNGALIGFAAGVLYCVVLCRNAGWMLMEGSAGMMIGSVIDAQMETKVSLYKRPETEAPRRSSGLFFTVRF